MYRLLSLVVLFFLSSTSVGQGLSVKVRIFDHGPQQADSALNRELATALQGALELRGMKSEKEGVQLYSRYYSRTAQLLICRLYCLL